MTEEEPRPPAFTDEALALQFAERHAKNLRYVAAWGKWVIWGDGPRWRADETLKAFDLARAVCREAAASCNTPRVAVALASARTVAAVLSLARADRRLAATADQWDADPWLLNTPAGLVDLRTGHRRPARPKDSCTRITGAAPAGDCPIWKAFLARVTGGDRELQLYLQRVAGYYLTGLTREHALFFAYGTGANGKSVFLNALAGMLGDYHRTAPAETFTASNTDRHSTELAGLRGARLVTVTETEAGRRWAESRIKALTGGDAVSARFMRHDFFEFIPVFKLLIAGNHRPGLRTVDEAIRRRFHLIPFDVTIPLEERDQTLPGRLEAERGGVLNWAVEGCLEWQRRGLDPPLAVREATAAYLEAEDSLAAWLNECCDRAPDAWESSSVLFKSWKDWAERSGEHVGSSKALVQGLVARGFEPVRKSSARGIVGIRIIGSGLERARREWRA